MKPIQHFNPLFVSLQKELTAVIREFGSSGTVLENGKRNVIKIFPLGVINANVKSFKIPKFYNKIVYRYFRKSKAKRSFEYANILMQNGIGTPQPIAYFENYDTVGLHDSYYVSEHLQADLTYRELVETDYPDTENILRQFTAFSFQLHEKGIEFLDHSPGNTLIKKNEEGKYDFFLVDLNRMKFHKQMSFETRMKNLSRLTPKKEMVMIMSDAYAKLYSRPYVEVFDKMWGYTSQFQERYFRKRRLKKRFIFWKK
ncbi:lipopolysaccharide kinase InaA family protein [Flavobacterium humi]|uniref:lipopolysaccharide kinase InaA family protein n=1 Tax=Flavobacterium humi TaxID=2562683 RepID=UPI0037430EED